MKIKSKILKILLICIILMLVLSFKQISYGSVLGGLAIVGIEATLVVAMQELVLVVGLAADALLTGITGGKLSSQEPLLGQVLFNKVPAVRANFFPQIQGGVSPNGAMSNIITQVGKIYGIVNNLAIALLLGVLIYIGIRMAISTVASEEAKYKKMFKDWAMGFALLFVLDLLIIAVFYFNDVLVETLYNAIEDKPIVEMSKLLTRAAIPIVGFPETIIYVSLITSELVFVLMYLKRIITLGFLIVIAPLITVTYSIDKIGDGKSQALNTWLKEFISTVLIQPFHCVIYIIFVNTAYTLVANNDLSIETDVLAIMSIFFLLKAEGIVKKIFGIKADSMSDALKTGATALGLLTALKSSKKPISKGKGKMPGMKDSVRTKGEAGAAPSKDGGDIGAIGGGTDNSSSNGSSSSSSSSSSSGSSSSSSVSSGGSTSSSSRNPDSNNRQYERDKKAAQLKAHADKEARKKELKPPSQLADEIRNHYKRKAAANGYNGDHAIVASVAGKVASGAAGIIGATMGATVGDAGTAVNTGYAMHNMASGIEGKMNDYNNQKQLDHNQQVFAGAYEEFAEEYRKEFGNVTDEQIWAAAEDIYEGGGANLEEGYQLDFYNQMDDLATSAEIMGYSDGMDYVKDSMRLASEGRIEVADDYQFKNYTYSEDELYKRDLKKIVKAEGGKDGPMYAELRELDKLIAQNRKNPDTVKMYKEMRRQKMEEFKKML